MKMGRKFNCIPLFKALLMLVMGVFLLTGCSGNAEGTIYLTGVSRLKIAVNGDGKVKEIQSLNKAGSTLLGDSSWKGETSDAVLDIIIPLLQSEDAEKVYIDVFSDNKTWESSEAERLTEKYGSQDGDKTPVEVRRIKDIDSLEEAWNGEAVSAVYEETEESIEETSPQETEESPEEETSAEETAQEETSAEETAAAAPATAAPTTAAPARTQPAARPTRAAAQTTAAQETTAPTPTETQPPEETLPPASDEGGEGAENPTGQAAESNTPEPEEATELDITPVSERSTEETTRSSVYIPPSEREVPYGPGWTEEAEEDAP